MAARLLMMAAMLHLCATKAVYKYEAQTIAAIPESGREINVLRLEFTVTAAIIGSGPDVLAQIDASTVKIHNFTGPRFPVPETILPMSIMTELNVNSASKTELARLLALPLVVSVDANGTISNIRQHSRDAFWSVNLKKGVLTLLQLNIKTDAGLYTVLEQDVTGNCPSTYLIQSREHYHGHDHSTPPTFLNVTKSRDYSNCTDRSVLRHSFISAIGLSDELLASKTIISNAKFAYNISGTKASGERFLVESAAAEGQHIFSFFKPLSGSMNVYTHQRIRLLSKDNSTKAMPADEFARASWSMAIPNVISANSDLKFDDDSVLREVRAAVSKLMDSEETSHMKGLYLHRILEKIRGAKLTAWDSLARAAAEAGPAYLKLLLDLAPSVGTLESLQKFQSSLPQLTPNITAQYFAVLGLFGEPTFEMIRIMKSICASAQVKETARERKACMLSFSSLLYNRYYRSGYYLKNATFPAEETSFLLEFQAYAERAFNASISSNTSELLLAVKCLGNLGSPMAITKLASIATSESFPIVARVHAIRAFRRMPASVYPLIQEILMPIFTDWHNDVELRIAAYRGVMNTQPPQAIFDLIAAALHQEHDEHVQTYVYSHLKVLAENPIASDMAFSDRARVALEGLTEIFPYGLQYSRYYRLIDTYDDDRNAGLHVDLSVVGSSRSMIPREACVWMQAVIFGVKANLAHICLRLEGIQRLLQKMIRVGGPVYPDFFAELDMSAIEYEDYHGLFDISIEGSEAQFIEIPPIISDMMGNPEVAQRRLLSLVGAVQTPIFKTLAFDSTLQIPSLLGVAVHLNNTFLLHLNLSLSELAIQALCQYDASQPCALSLKPQAQYRIGSQHSLGIDAGAGLIQSKVLLHSMLSRERTDDRNWTISYSRNGQNFSLAFEALLPRKRVTTGHSEVVPLLVTVDRSKQVGGETGVDLAQQFYVTEMNAWHVAAVPDVNYDWASTNIAGVTGFLMGYNRTKTSCLPCLLVPGKARPPFCGRVIRDFYVIPQANAPETLLVRYDRSIWTRDPERGRRRPSGRNRTTINAIDPYDDFTSVMMDDLSALSRQIDELQSHMASESAQHGLKRSRHRRHAQSALFRSGSSAASRSVDDDTEEDANQGGSLSVIEISGFRDGVKERRIQLSMKRSPTGKPRQFRRDSKLTVDLNRRRIATICSDARVQYPRDYVSLLAGGNVAAEPQFSYDSKITYGTSDCQDNDDDEIEVHLKFSRSNEQKALTRYFREGLPAANRYHFAVLCRADLAKNFTYTWPCRHLFTELNEAHRVELSIKADQVPGLPLPLAGVDLRKIASAALQNLRTAYWSNLRSSFVRDVKKTKEMKFVGERNLQLPLLIDFNITTPESTNEFRSVMLKHGAQSLYFPMYYSVAYHLSGYRLPGVCAVQRIRGTTNGVYVSTFDNEIFSLTQPNCSESTELNVLLAADCSSAVKFAVSANYQTATKQLEVRIATAAIPVTIRPAARTGMPEVFVDNLKVVDEEYSGTGLTVTFQSGIITIRFDIGIFIKWTPDGALLIGVSPLYSGVTCGWCGDYNGQKVDEFTMADGSITDDSRQFARSYVSGLPRCEGNDIA